MDNSALFLLVFQLNHHYPLLDSVMIFATQYLLYLAPIFSLILAIKGGGLERRAFGYILICIPLAVLIIKLIHLFYLTDRPFVTLDIEPLIRGPFEASFPSRHTSIMSALYFSYLITKSRWASLFLILLILVGISRVYVGVHYPIDILGGVLVGLTSVLIIWKLKKVFF